jgi:cytidylate kinase
MISSRARPVVAIDGPAGSGKSTVARALAARLGYLYVDTGAMYRAVALAAVRAGIALDDGPALGALCLGLSLRQIPGPAGSRTLLGDEDVSRAIRTPEMSRASSSVSAAPEVRAAMAAQQRRMGECGGTVLEGRDIGTVVFPDAEAKFFLTASTAERARRRRDELAARGDAQDLEAVRREMEERDRNDSARAHSPLRRAADAVEIDTTALTPAEVVELMAARVLAREGYDA